MLKRNVVLRDFVGKLEDVELCNTLLPVSFERRIDAFLTTLKELNDVAVKL